MAAGKQVQASDVYPQKFPMAVVQSGVGAFTVAEYATAISNKPMPGGKTQVWSIDKIVLYIEAGGLTNGANNRIAITDRRPVAFPAAEDPSVLCTDNHLTIEAAGGGMFNIFLAKEFHMFGILYGKSKIFICCGAQNQAGVVGGQAHIFYRWVGVSAQEFVGILSEN